MKQLSDQVRHTLRIRQNFRIAALRVPCFDIGVPKHFVEYPVIAALNNEVLVFAGKGPRDPHCSHYCFGSGIRKSDQFGSRHHFADPASHFVLELCRKCENATDVHAIARCLVNAVVRVAENCGTIAETIVNVLIAIDVPDTSAFSALHVDSFVVSPVTEVGRYAERQLGHGLAEMRIGLLE